MSIKKIECIQNLIRKDLFEEMRAFIVESKFATYEDFTHLNHEFEKATFIFNVLEKAVRDEKLILLDYEWSILPLERLRITCVTLREKVEFSYGY